MGATGFDGIEDSLNGMPRPRHLVNHLEQQ